MKNAFDGLFSRVDMAEETVSLWVWQETSPKLKKKKKKKKKKIPPEQCSRCANTYKVCNIHIMGELKGKERIRSNMWSNEDWAVS